jgi:hypothetical protein
MSPAPPILDMVQRLIAFDTVSRNSNLDLIAFAQSKLEQAGAKTRLTYDTAKTKANVFASLGPQQDGGYVLSGHTDVVPVDGQDWSANPFAAEIREGRVYGRGTADMKVHRCRLGAPAGICRARFEATAPSPSPSTKKWLRRCAATAGRPQRGPDQAGACRDRRAHRNARCRRTQGGRSD